MAAVSKSEIFRKYSIRGGLGTFRDLFRSACAKLGYREVPDTVQQFNNEGEVLQPTTMLLNVYRT
jgi:hypothetical protein